MEPIALNTEKMSKKEAADIHGNLTDTSVKPASATNLANKTAPRLPPRHAKACKNGFAAFSYADMRFGSASFTRRDRVAPLLQLNRQ